MRQHSDVAGIGRQPDGARGRRGAGGEGKDTLPLSRTQMRELRRRIRDLDDRRRYLLVDVFAPQFALFYNVSDDTYGMNEPTHATLFKRRAAAAAIQRCLRPRIRIVRCRVSRAGQLVVSSVALPPRRRRPARTIAR